ncbi:MAG: sulfatase-like hydrolase/transferase, partial [Fimbriimonadaceae bacterium]|nr:sulfatase-like hydrolase/transferase [Chitinophagales bacterium]
MKKTVSVFVSIILIHLYIHAQTQPNIVVIICDDLNDYVQGFDGQPQTITPNLAELASNGTTFINNYCPAPLCAPSRTSLVMGKTPDYTDVYINGMFDCTNFRNNFEPGKYVLTFPQYLKDSANYFTYNISKLFHCDAGQPDFDTETADPCEKELSWNKFLSIGNDDTLNNIGQDEEQGLEEIKWALIDSEYVNLMADYQMVDTAAKFIREYFETPSAFCDKPFMMSMGFRRPHSNLYIPEQYFLDDYILDFYEEPYDINFNVPYNAYPYNGLVMPPQPDPPYDDFYNVTPFSRFQIPTS